MASIAEQLLAGAAQTAQTAPDFAGGIQKGAQLAESIAQVQQRREQLEQQKQQVQQQKFEKVGQWLTDYSKMPEGPAKKAFGNKFIPTGIGALGLGDKIDPTIIDMSKSDPTFAAFLVSNVRRGDLSVADLTNPDKVASLYAKVGKQFGDMDKFQSVVTENLEPLGEAEKFAQSEEGKAARAATISGSKQTQQGIGNLQDLRKEYTSHPTTKKTFEVADSYGKIRTNLTGKPSAARDMAAIFSYMKILDPNSTVREGEYASAKNAGGIPDKIITLYEGARNGQILSPQQRKEFLSAAGRLYASQYESQKKVDQDYTDIARSTGLNPKLVITGNRIKAPPKDDVKTKTYDIGGVSMTKEQAEAFFKANPQFADQKKGLGL